MFGRGQFIGYLSQLGIQLSNAFALSFALNAECGIALAIDSEFVILLTRRL